MKCIRFKQNGETVVRRTDDETAHQLVKDNRAEYACKQDWKEMGRLYLFTQPDNVDMQTDINIGRSHAIYTIVASAYYQRSFIMDSDRIH